MVPIGGIQRAVVKALRYARTLSPDVRAVYVEIDPASTETLRGQWGEWGQGVELVVLESPYRSLMEPLLEYIEDVQHGDPNGYVTVILPEFVPRRLWQHLLHNQHALLIKGALLFKPNVVVTSVPFHLGRRAWSPAPVALVDRTPEAGFAALTGCGLEAGGGRWAAGGGRLATGGGRLAAGTDANPASGGGPAPQPRSRHRSPSRPSNPLRAAQNCSALPSETSRGLFT